MCISQYVINIKLCFMCCSLKFNRPNWAFKHFAHFNVCWIVTNCLYNYMRLNTILWFESQQIIQCNYIITSTNYIFTYNLVLWSGSILAIAPKIFFSFSAAFIPSESLLMIFIALWSALYEWVIETFYQLPLYEYVLNYMVA